MYIGGLQKLGLIIYDGMSESIETLKIWEV